MKFLKLTLCRFCTHLYFVKSDAVLYILFVNICGTHFDAEWLTVRNAVKRSENLFSGTLGRVPNLVLLWFYTLCLSFAPFLSPFVLQLMPFNWKKTKIAGDSEGESRIFFFYVQAHWGVSMAAERALLYQTDLQDQVVSNRWEIPVSSPQDRLLRPLYEALRGVQHLAEVAHHHQVLPEDAEQHQ